MNSPTVQYKCEMQLRDFFAAQAIAPLLASDGFEVCLVKGGMKLEDIPRYCAKMAYEIADELLKAREREEPT